MRYCHVRMSETRNSALFFFTSPIICAVSSLLPDTHASLFFLCVLSAEQNSNPCASCNSNVSEQNKLCHVALRQVRQLTGKVSLRCRLTGFTALQLRYVTACRSTVLVQVSSFPFTQTCTVWKYLPHTHKQDRFGSADSFRLVLMSSAVFAFEGSAVSSCPRTTFPCLAF